MHEESGMNAAFTFPLTSETIVDIEHQDAKRLRERRQKAKQQGLCSNCFSRPALFQRQRCQLCQMKAIIKEAFKFDRGRQMLGSTNARGSCYVPQYNPLVRREWTAEIIGKWDSRCFYTGLQIEIGSTAGLNFKLPASRADEFGPSIVFHPQNLVWCHQGIALLKGNMTATKFKSWLSTEFLPLLQDSRQLTQAP